MRNQEFDVIICDLNIKGSVGGDTVNNVLRMQETAKRGPTIVVSGNIDTDIMRDYGKQIKAAFVKPVDMDLLIESEFNYRAN